jgi:WD40 repeat protein
VWNVKRFDSKNVYRWSLKRAARSIRRQGHADRVHTVTASADGQVGASTAADGSIVVWDLSGIQPAISRQIPNRNVRQLCLSSDGQTLFFTRDGNTVKRSAVWDLSQHTLFRLSNGVATALLTSENDQVLCVGCDDGSLSAWDINQSCEIWKVADAHYEEILSLYSLLVIRYLFERPVVISYKYEYKSIGWAPGSVNQ